MDPPPPINPKETPITNALMYPNMIKPIVFNVRYKIRETCHLYLLQMLHVILDNNYSISTKRADLNTFVIFENLKIKHEKWQLKDIHTVWQNAL